MIIPIELQRIVLRKGYLSPEITLGWRLADYLRDFFGGLELLRVLVARDGDALLSLRVMASWYHAEPIQVATSNRGWDFLVYHPATGTLLGVTRAPERTDLPRQVETLEPALAEGDLGAQLRYQRTVTKLVDHLLDAPFEQLCRIDEHRLRRIAGGRAAPSAPKIRCRRCGNPVRRSRLWELDGVLCCLTCTGMSAQWFDRQ